jgi:hypothetical protein
VSEAQHYEISVLIGPCTEEESEALAVTLLEAAQPAGLGAAVAVHGPFDIDEWASRRTKEPRP